MRRAPLVLGIVAALALAAGVVRYSAQRAGAPPPGDASRSVPAPPGKRTAPQFSLADINGNRVDSSRFSGKPLVINFFATWCPPCREEIPGFVAVYDKYREQGFELVGISLDAESRRSLPEFIASNRIGYRILLGDVATVQAFGWGSGIPATFFIGKDGEIRNFHMGYMDRDAFDREVQKLL